MNTNASQISDYAEVFDIRAQMYHTAMQRYPDVRRQEFLIPLSKLNLHPGDRLIDLPAGGGYLQEYLPADIKVHCLEASQAFCNFCHASGYQASLYQHDTLPLPDQYANALLSIAGIHHVADKAALFAEMYRILKNNAVICVADVASGSAVARFLDTVVHRYTSTGDRGLYLSDDTALLIQQAGFQISSHEPVEYCWKFTSIQAMTDYCKLLFGMEKASPEQVLEGIRELLHYDQHSNGEVNLHWSLYCITGHK